MSKRFFLMCFLLLFLWACKEKEQPILNINKTIASVSFGYHFDATDNQTVNPVSFLLKNNKLFQVSNKTFETINVNNLKKNVFNAIIDSLPNFNYFKNPNIGNLSTKNDDTPWYVHISFKDSSEIKIASNNLPIEFKNYDQLLVKTLTSLYNR